MVVLYNIGTLEWHLAGRWLVPGPHLALPNILAGREIVPEFMHAADPPERIADAAAAILADPERRRAARDALAEVRRAIDRPGAAENAAREVLDLVGEPVPPLPPGRPGFAI
jgi:lipid-A-disaccharide synthase